MLDIKTTNQAEGLQVIRSMVQTWSAERAQLNYLKSLETLDWRWRIKALADVLGTHSLLLDAELKRLHQAVASARAAGSTEVVLDK